MEQVEGKEVGERGSRKSLSPSKHDSLTDFKSPKLELAAPIRAKIIIDKRSKKSTAKGKNSGKKKKETVTKEVAQPSIESSFFKATINAKRDGHTCPVCMKYFADLSTGASHTKICAAKHYVSTKKLLAAVALQERQANERLAIGLPAGPIVKPKDKAPRRPREVGAKADPDLQLAVALSVSHHEDQIAREFEEACLLAAEHRSDGLIEGFSSYSEKRKTLTNFGFLTNKPVGVSEAPGRTRRKKHMGPTILQTRSQEARDRLLTERVAEILMGNEAITQVCRQEANAEVEPVKDRHIILKSRLLREIHRTTNRVWDLAQMSAKIADFYVEDLAPVIVPFESVKQENAENLCTEDGNNDEKNVENKKDVHPAFSEESPFEEDDMKAEKISISSEKRENVKESPENHLTIPSPDNIHITDRQYRNTLPMDWTNTLNVSSMSDVVVIVKNGHIWAHKLVFYVRCSDILLDCETNSDEKFSHVKEKISWPDIDLFTGLAFLEFVYSGLIEKNIKFISDNNVAIGVRRLARKYKVKALFDYLRRKQADFDNINNESEEVKSLKSDSYLPLPIEVHKALSDVKNIEENLPKKAKSKDPGQAEGRKSGLCSPIVIEVAATPNDIEPTKENVPTNEDNKDVKEDCAFLESNEKDLNISMQKTTDSNLESQNTDTMSVISIGSSRSRVSMSPDLFDDTTEEASLDTAKNCEEIEENGDLSDVENSNNEVLADLIGRNDNSSFSKASRQSATSPVIRQDKIAEKSRSFHKTSEFSALTQLVETPKSRSNSALEVGTNIRVKSRSQLFPEEPKSNLSLFISKMQKINAKGPLDSFTEEESLAEPTAIVRRRNPFNVNNITNKSMEDCNEKISSKLHRGRDGKRGLSVFDEPIKPINSKKVNTEEKMNVDENVEANDNFKAEESYLVDETLITDEEDTSMYSKYRKNHTHNNSISNYRNLLKKLANTTTNAENDVKSDNPISPDEKPIDLTQESDSDTDITHNHISPVSSLNKQQIAHDSSDSDSIHSAVTAIAHCDKLHELSDEEESKDAETVKAQFVTSSDERKNNDDKTKRNNYSQNPQTDSDDDLTGSTSTEKIGGTAKTKLIMTSGNIKNVPKYHIEISPKGAMSTRKSPRNSNHDLLEGDEEIFARSWNSKSPSPLKNSTASPDKILSSGRKPKTKGGKMKNVSSDDDSRKKHVNMPEYSIDILPQSEKSSRNFPQYSDRDLLEGDTEIFARSWNSKSPSPSRNTAASTNNILSLGRKENLKGEKTKSVSSVDDLNENQQNIPKYSIDISSGSGRGSGNSPRYSNHDSLEEADEILARSWKSRTPSPLPNFSASAAETFSSGRKRKSEEIAVKHRNIIDNLNATKKSSKGAKSPRNSPEYSDLDVFEIDEEMLDQSLKKARIWEKSPSPSQKINFNHSGNSTSHRKKRRSDEKKSKETSFVADLTSKNVTNSPDYPEIEVDDLLTQNIFEAVERFSRSLTPPKKRSCGSPEKSDSSERKRRSNRRIKAPEIGIDNFEKSKLIKSSETANSLINLTDYHYEVFEPDDRVFTQSFNLPHQSPCRNLSPLPLCPSTSKNNDHSSPLKIPSFSTNKNNCDSSTLKIPSPILINSSPEFDVDAEINFSNHEPNAFISNKENLFANDRTSSPSTRKSYDNLAEVISPTNFENSLRYSGDDFEKSVERNFRSNLERPTSPQPSTSRKSSTNRKDSENFAKNPLMRWNSMPANASKSQIGSKRVRTPTASSRFIMSQDVTPPVNYDAMDTPQLKKELSKYGIKPQPRTRARKLLTHIYNELHPLVPASPEDNNLDDHLPLSDDDEPPTKRIGKPSNRNSEDSDSGQELPLSQESVTSTANVIPEEMDFPDGNTSPDDAEETCKNSIKKAFKALLKEDKDMHNQVLTYEPLQFELLHLMLKTGGLKCKPKELMDFLDEECITFQMQSQRNNNRGRGRKTARGRKGTTNTQK